MRRFYFLTVIAIPILVGNAQEASLTRVEHWTTKSLEGRCTEEDSANRSRIYRY
jgi:hypothetical protein